MLARNLDLVPISSFTSSNRPADSVLHREIPQFDDLHVRIRQTRSCVQPRATASRCGGGESRIRGSRVADTMVPELRVGGDGLGHQVEVRAGSSALRFSDLDLGVEQASFGHAAEMISPT